MPRARGGSHRLQKNIGVAVFQRGIQDSSAQSAPESEFDQRIAW